MQIFVYAVIRYSADDYTVARDFLANVINWDIGNIVIGQFEIKMYFSFRRIEVSLISYRNQDITKAE